MRAELPYINSPEELEKLNGFFKPFPEIDDIFVENQSWLKDHFLPLISIDLSVFKDEWRGQVLHLLNPYEPYEGYIGNRTEEYHNEFTSENWIAFKLTDDNRYEFLGNEGYFERTKYHLANLDESFLEYFDKKFEDYQKCKVLFHELGYLTNIHSNIKAPREKLLCFIGGDIIECMAMNCFNSDTIPVALYHNFPKWNPEKEMMEEESSEEDGYKILYDGNPFYVITTVPAYYYGCSGADTILLMYEPVSKIVLFTFDYS